MDVLDSLTVNVSRSMVTTKETNEKLDFILRSSELTSLEVYVNSLSGASNCERVPGAADGLAGFDKLEDIKQMLMLLLLLLLQDKEPVKDDKEPIKDISLKDCNMELGSIPEDQRIPATTFMDLCAARYSLDLKDMFTHNNLNELSFRNLLDLVCTRYLLYTARPTTYTILTVELHLNSIEILLLAKFILNVSLKSVLMEGKGANLTPQESNCTL